MNSIMALSPTAVIIKRTKTIKNQQSTDVVEKSTKNLRPSRKSTHTLFASVVLLILDCDLPALLQRCHTP